MAGLGLKLYALAVRAPDVAAEPPPPRPAGRLVWLHLAPGMQTKGVAELARRIGAEDGHAVLLTGGDAPAALGDAIWQPPPVDRAVAVRAFLDHWRPDAVFLAGGELRPVALTELKRRAVPVAMIECGAPSLPDGRERWFPGLVRAGLDQMHAIHAVDGAAARALLRAGSDAIVTGRMEEPSAALPCNEAERAALIRQSPLSGRYDRAFDRESAYEVLAARAAEAQQNAAQTAPAAESAPGLGSAAGELLGNLASQAMKTAVRQVANQIGRQLVRGLMGSLLGGKRR